MRRIKATVFLDQSDDDTIATLDLPFPAGEIVRAFHDIPDMTGSAALTAQVEVLNAEGHALYTKSGMAENASTPDDLGAAPKAVHPNQDTGRLQVKVTLSGAEAADRTFVSWFYVK